MRTTSLWYIPVGLLALALLRADVERPGAGTDPGVKDGEKEEKEGKAEPEMGKPGKPGEPGKKIGITDREGIHKNLAAEGEENLREIVRLMEKVRGSLSRKETGDATQGDQREVVRKIDDLIEKLKKMARSSSSSSSQDQQDQQEKQQSKDRKKQSGADSQRAENEKQQANPDPKTAKDPKTEPKGSGKVPNDRTEIGKLPPSKTATLQEKAEILERWGLLPKRVVEQMRNSNGKEYPAEYREIISRYYERLSEIYEEVNRGR